VGSAVVGVDLAEFVNDDGKKANFDATFLFERMELIGDGKIFGNVQNGFGGDFGAFDGAAIAHGTSENVPAVINVGEDGRVRGCCGSRGLRMNRSGADSS